MKAHLYPGDLANPPTDGDTNGEYMSYGEHDVIGRWSIDKLSFLEKYIPAYLRATSRSYQRFYIDGFAGKGRWIHKNTGESVDGSPAIVLRNAEKFTHLHFIECDPVRAEQLNELVGYYKATNKTTVHIGDCNETIPKIMQKINYKAPSFVFLDPSKDQLKWSTISTLSQWKTELFILFPLNMTLLRFLPRHGNIHPWAPKRLTPLFGTEEWKSLYDNVPRHDLAQALLNLYTNRLRSLGYNHINVSRIFKNDNGQRLYYMIWVGKHPIGKKIMDTVFEQQPGQLELF